MADALIAALPALLAYVRELEQWQRDMIEKAAERSLDGYRELAARAAAAENERDEARYAALAMRERCAQACEEIARSPANIEDRTGYVAYDCAGAIRALEVRRGCASHSRGRRTRSSRSRRQSCWPRSSPGSG